MTDQALNIGDPDQVQERSKKAKTARDIELDDLRFILADKRGRRFVRRLLESTELFAVSKVMNASIYALEGKREIGKLLFSDLMDAQPDAYLLMMKESKE